jgi:hypothetical protein
LASFLRSASATSSCSETCARLISAASMPRPTRSMITYSGAPWKAHLRPLSAAHEN